MPAERSQRGGRRTRPLAGPVGGVVLVALLLGLIGWSVATLQPPAAAPTTAPATQFSADRAFAHVQQLATRVHVAGSDADAANVESLVATLTRLGLDTRVQNSVGAWGSAPGSTEMARVRNVVAVLPGTHPTGRLFLMAHHDSVQNGPGASDDSAGVSTLLETARALKAGPRLRNDVVLVLTDAEEACLCGAEAFASSHPLAAGGGVVLNVEARGTTGPPILFETSRGNADLAASFAAAAPHPVATSFAVEVYRALPNDTDFSVMLKDGFTGLNTAFIDGAAAYHTRNDVPERLDRRSLQALGDNTLAMARQLGNRDLSPVKKPAAGDATYFPVLGKLVHYPGRLVWPLAIAAALAVLGFALALRARGISSLPRTVGGAALALLPLVLAPLAAQALWWLLVVIRPGYAPMLDPWQPGWYRLATVAVVAAVVLLWYALLRRRIGPGTLAVGALAWLAVLGGVLAALAPGGSYLAAWPALAGGVTGMIATLTSSRGIAAVAALVTGAVAPVVLAPAVALFFPALGLRTGAAAAFFATLLALALLPAFEFLFPDPERAGRRSGWASVAVPGTALVLAAACAAAGLIVDRLGPDRPVPSQLAYALDTDTGHAWWASTETHPGAYTALYVDGRTPLPVDYPYLAGADLATGPARAADLPAPEVTTVSDEVLGGHRYISVQVRSRRPGVRLIAVDLTASGDRIVGARLVGEDVPATALGGSRLRVTFHAPGADGVQAMFTVDGSGPVSLRAIDGSDGLSGLPGYVPRPAGIDAAGTHSSDLVLVSATTSLGRPAKA
ncbi:MAG: M28 family peptidase [Blastococcus sp.]